jgi:hypothetical protein
MVSIKIQCPCGQRYAFDVEPVNGRMPSTVACPACGTNGTDAANEIIAQNLARQSEAPHTPGLRLQTVPAAPAAHSVPPAPPPFPSTRVTPTAKSKAKLAWYEYVWICLPITLVYAGGLIGGLCGGAACAINRTVFKQTKNPILRYVWTGLISALAGTAYLVVAVFFLSLFNKPAGAGQPYHWRTVTSQDGRFTALFPGQPKARTRNELLFKLHALAFDSGRTEYLVGYMDYPPKLHVRPTKQAYDGARNGALGKDGKLLEEKSITIGGFPGREIKVEKKGEFNVDRYFLDGNRMYQVMVTVPIPKQSSTNIPLFLDSFHLLKTGQSRIPLVFTPKFLFVSFVCSTDKFPGR